MKEVTGRVKPQLGQILQVDISSFHRDTGIAQLKPATGNKDAAAESLGIEHRALKVGSLVKCKVAKISDLGAEVKFCGAFRGLLHMDYASGGADGMEKGSVLVARVMAIIEAKDPGAGGEGNVC